MRIYILFMTCLAALSCGSKPHLASSDKFHRVEIEQDDYRRPAFFYKSYRPDEKNASRSPASINEDSETSAKTVYFLGLWQQKLKMEQILGLSSNEHCPAFHNDLLKHEKRFSAANGHNLKKDWLKIVSQGDLASNPILALPYDNDKDLYTFYQEEKSLDQSAVTQAFKTFYEQTKNETRQLCQTGSSDGYFIYANLVEYYSKDESFMSSENALKALLKVPSVANFFVLHSLEQKSFHSGADPIELEMLKKLNASWMESYLYNVKKLGDDKVSSNKTGNKRGSSR